VYAVGIKVVRNKLDALKIDLDIIECDDDKNKLKYKILCK